MSTNMDSQGEAQAIMDTNIEDIMELMKYANNLTHNDLNYAGVSIWDFAGQSAFYGTHQVFLSPRVVYLLVTDISKHIQDVVKEDECYFDSTGSNYHKITEYVEFWLNSIHGYCASQNKGVPPVILVGTHADKLDQENQIELSEQYFEALRNVVVDQVTHDHLVDENFAINNTIIDPKLTDLRDKILKVASEQHHWGELIPARWITLEKALIGLEDKGLKICTKDSLLNLNKALPVPLTSDAELSLFLRFQHDAGNIIYFSDSELCDHILLDPQWLVDAFKCLITAKMFVKNKSIYPKWREFNKNAILKHELIDDVWTPAEQPGFHDHRDQIIALLEKLDMIARPRSFVADGEGVKVEDCFLVPCMLKKLPDTADLQPPTLDDAISTSTICFTMTTGFIPMALFNRLLSSCLTRWPVSKQGQQYLIYCGVGVFDVDRHHRLTLFFSQNVIQIWVKKLSQKNPHPSIEVCSRVREYIEETFVKIEKQLRETCEFKLKLKCPDVDMRSNSGMFDLEEFQTDDGEVCCHCHDNSHVLISSDMLKYWGFEEAVSKEELSEHNMGTSRMHERNSELKKPFNDALCQSTHDNLNTTMQSVGALIGPNGIGTVFAVGQKYVMTAWHVVRGIIQDRFGVVDISKMDQAFVNFNENPMQPCVNQYSVKREIPFIDEDLDVAVLEIRDPSHFPNYVLLCKHNVTCTDLTDISLCGFGQPGSHKKHIEHGCQIIKPNSTRVNTACAHLQSKISGENTKSRYYKAAISKIGKNASLVDLGYNGFDDESKFLFTSFMEHGASGSPLLTATYVPGTVYAVGVMTCGLPHFYFDLPVLVQCEFPKEYRCEMGARMSHVYVSMCKKNPTLAQELF